MKLKKRSQEIFSERYNALVRKVDRLFGYLFIFQWLLGITFSLTLSPQTWSGDVSQTHINVFAAIFLGGLIAGLPIYLVFSNPGATLNRLVVAFSQILYSALLIHFSGGRIETHFHVFGSLAFLASYRDCRPILIGTLVTLADHLIRGAFWPESVYGIVIATPWRALEHAAWVAFVDLVLFYSINLAVAEMRSGSESQASLEDSRLSLQSAHDAVEIKVLERTRELEESKQLILSQQQTMLTTSKMSALGEMAGGIAHEINSPLAAIRTLSSQIEEVMTDEPLNKELVTEMASKIVQTSDRISKIIRGLKYFSRDDSQDTFSPVNVKHLIEETLSFCRDRFKSNGTLLKVEGLSEGCCFDGRPTEISQVLLNLLNNAHDAISGLQDKWIQLTLTETQDSIEFRVSDSGPGIPPEAQKKIFQPFFTTKEIGKGTGMGLSISLGIVRSHGGELELDSECRNTCFIVRLPKRHRARMDGEAA